MENKKICGVAGFSLNMLAAIAATVAWFVVTIILSVIVGILVSIPIIGAIIYYPADSMWAATVILNTVPIFVGAAVSSAISKNTACKWSIKAYCILAILIGAVPLAMEHKFLAAIVAAVSAIICWGMDNEN